MRGRDPEPRAVAPLPAAVHLGALSSFALAQPLFEVLGRTPEFFVVRGDSRREIYVLALALIVVPPAALAAVEAAAAILGRRVRWGLHLVLVGGLVFVAALHALTRLGGTAAALVGGAALVGATAAAAYARSSAVRSFLTLLAPAPLLFAALFLFHSPVSELTLGDSGEANAAASVRVGASTPVVVVVFDEFPVFSLLDERGRIDGARFPHFAELARRSIWFRNATSVADDTLDAVPAVLTGRYPRRGSLPTLSHHPQNLFTLLAGEYKLKVFESVTRLCPSRACATDARRDDARLLASDLGVVYLHLLLPEELRDGLPPIDDRWANFRGGGAGPALQRRRPLPKKSLGDAFSDDRRLQFDGFLEALDPADPPRTLYFLHSLLPHRPWAYLPSGRQYGAANTVFGTGRGYWTQDEWLVDHGYRRYLLQLVFVDRLVGKLVARLRSTGLYDRALLVVAADHGVGFRRGEALRKASRANLAELAGVPLFVKPPRLRRGATRDAIVKTIDVLPTIARALGFRLPAKVDGRPLLGAALASRETVRVAGRSGRVVEAPAAAFLEQRREVVTEKLRVFGAHTRERALYAAGPHRALFGRRVAAVTRGAASGISARIERRDEIESATRDSTVAPTRVTARLTGSAAQPHAFVAVAVNDRIAAVARTFKRQQAVALDALVPESALREGQNELRLFLIEQRGGRVRLAPIRLS